MKKSIKKVEATKEEEEELDGKEQSIECEEATNHVPLHSKAEQDPSDAPKRPTDITLRQISTAETVVKTASSIPSGVLTSTPDTAYVQQSSSSSDDFIRVSLLTKSSDDSSNMSQTKSKTPQTQKNLTLPKLLETKESPSSPPPMFSTDIHFTEGEDFFTINEMHLCICGQWLCVSNTGGVVMAFDFRLKSSEKKEPKVSYNLF